ncbi:hypothetical protein OG889_29335 [Streptomyces sp. NBC_00481]|uniref:hypothetical protein n=1 Tax=Streptomyces sp. NBC_00481 TaxID=2975755 RepID=UPI002DD9C8C9|nr:hypothetical protein [Streptomyces sp. NBC_00481]WRY98446.1 hypothetical protein OG889_29335 [Streptomyces sp. NBC_00481]
MAYGPLPRVTSSGRSPRLPLSVLEVLEVPVYGMASGGAVALWATSSRALQFVVLSGKTQLVSSSEMVAPPP